MRIDHCPKCKKAGLKYQRIHTLVWQPDTRTESEKQEQHNNFIQHNKWCPRCKEWVTPVHGEWKREEGTIIHD